jgi:hypothetical protein
MAGSLKLHDRESRDTGRLSAEITRSSRRIIREGMCRHGVEREGGTLVPMFIMGVRHWLRQR